MQIIKTRADDLALPGAPIDEEEITDKILDGLSNDYKELVRAVQARDTSITFEELHDKLLNFEASLQAQPTEPHHFPATANPTYRNNNRTWRPSQPQHQSTNTWRPSYNPTPRPPAATHPGPQSSQGPRPTPRPYLGYCQICRIQGHTAKRCPSFRRKYLEWAKKLINLRIRTGPIKFGSSIRFFYTSGSVPDCKNREPYITAWFTN